MNLVFPPLYAIIDAALLKTSELSFVEMMADPGLSFCNIAINAPAAGNFSKLLDPSLPPFLVLPSRAAISPASL